MTEVTFARKGKLADQYGNQHQLGASWREAVKASSTEPAMRTWPSSSPLVPTASPTDPPTSSSSSRTFAACRCHHASLSHSRSRSSG